MKSRRQIRNEIARRTTTLPDYATRRLHDCHGEIVHYATLERTATTLAEKRFCHEMIEMYLKRYNWYLKWNSEKYSRKSAKRAD